MPKIRFEFVDRTSFEAEVNETFAVQYDEIKDRQDLVNRKETRRHQSLYKSMDRGWEFSDRNVNVEKEIERKESISELHNAMKLLTNKQRIILISYAIHGLSFREIGDRLHISKETVREHYWTAINKMKKLLIKNLL